MIGILGQRQVRSSAHKKPENLDFIQHHARGTLASVRILIRHRNEMPSILRPGTLWTAFAQHDTSLTLLQATILSEGDIQHHDVKIHLLIGRNSLSLSPILESFTSSCSRHAFQMHLCLSQEACEPCAG